MRNRMVLVCLLVVAIGLGLPVGAGAQPPDEFAKRREAVRAKMEPGSVLVLRSPAPAGESFRQDNSLYYLAGIDEPNTSLVLWAPRPAPPVPPDIAAQMPSGMRLGPPRETLFIQPPAPSGRPGEARVQAPAPAVKLEKPGFETVRPSADFQGVFEDLLMGAGAGGPMMMLAMPGGGAGGPGGQAPIIYLDYQRSRRVNEPMTADEQLLQRARDKGAQFSIRPAMALVTPFRRVKSPQELDRIRTAVTITAEAQKEAMRAAKPGMFEYQIQSIIEHVFSVNGARRLAFPTIVGSGPNSIILHWSRNNRQTQPGDVIVMDIGAEYDLYAADITRTIPVSGTFTPRQRAVYETVLKANQAAIEMIAPGVNMRDVNGKVNEILTQGLIDLKLIKDKSELRKYYTHGLSHGVGLQVHDVGGGVLEPGMVITIEPGLYLPEEAIGVRVEDSVLVTDKGHEVLSAAAPKTVAEVEALMKQDGIDYSRYLVKPAVGAR